MACRVTTKTFSSPNVSANGFKTRTSPAVEQFVHFRNQQRHVGIHAVISRVADHGIAGAREILFCAARDRRIERGKNKVALQRRREASYHQVAGSSGNRRVEMPANGLRIRFPGRALGGGYFGQLEPRMIRKQTHQSLADQTGRAEHAGTQLSVKARSWRAHACTLASESEEC